MQADRGGTVVVLATGGTIAGTSTASSPRGYLAGQVDIADLMRGVTLPMGASVRAEQVAQIDSKDMTHAVWRELALRCAHHLAANDVAGVVVTHGTDTMEETAVFLDAVLAPRTKPVVLTGAMRPADAADADGPLHIAQAVALAAMPEARGVLVWMGGRGHAARDARKAHPFRLDAFDGGGVAPLVRWVDGCPQALLPPALWPVSERGRPEILAGDPARWPRVEIVASHGGSDGRLVDALQSQGDLRGLIVATTGNGTLHVELEAALVRAAARGVAVRRVTRCAEGRIEDRDLRWPPSPVSGLAKARVALMVALAAEEARAAVMLSPGTSS